MNEIPWRAKWTQDQIRVLLLKQFETFWVDFYLPETRQIFQVTQNIEHPATREREICALSEAMRTLGLAHGTILTDANLDPIAGDDLTIEIRSLAEWLLDL